MRRNITYRRASYNDSYEKKEIIRLYNEIFEVDISENYDLWFSENIYGEPLGIVAVDDENSKIVGHFASVMLLSDIDGEALYFRMSMGFMTDTSYRGMGIATNLYKELKKEIIREGKASFIIGFPNDVSVNMHVNKMEYSLYKEFQFVTIPRINPVKMFEKVSIEEFESNESLETEKNRIVHTTDYLKWRFADKKYVGYVSEDGKLFVCTKFRNKIDLLYWDMSAEEKDILNFAGFLYKHEKIDSVATWNSTNFLNEYHREERKYYMCINFLDADSKLKKKINKSWLFYMGDCELF